MAVVDAATVTVVHRAVLALHTEHAVQVVDLTPLVAAVVERAGLLDGLVTVTTRHTTTGLMVNEYEPLLGHDIAAMLARLVPRGVGYAHDDLDRRPDVPADERANGHAHCRAVLLRTSETVPVADGQLDLGRWQRLLFVECDGAQRRQVSVTCLGLGRDAHAPPWRLPA